MGEKENKIKLKNKRDDSLVNKCNLNYIISFAKCRYY